MSEDLQVIKQVCASVQADLPTHQKIQKALQNIEVALQKTEAKK